jgi:hypothetical protein
MGEPPAGGKPRAREVRTLGGCSVDSGVRRLMASRYLFADDGNDDRNDDKRESSAEGALTHGRPYGGMSHLARLGTLAPARSAPWVPYTHYLGIPGSVGGPGRLPGIPLERATPEGPDQRIPGVALVLNTHTRPTPPRIKAIWEPAGGRGPQGRREVEATGR